MSEKLKFRELRVLTIDEGGRVGGITRSGMTVLEALDKEIDHFLIVGRIPAQIDITEWED